MQIPRSQRRSVGPSAGAGDEAKILSSADGEAPIQKTRRCAADPSRGTGIVTRMDDRRASYRTVRLKT